MNITRFINVLIIFLFCQETTAAPAHKKHQPVKMATTEISVPREEIYPQQLLSLAASKGGCLLSMDKNKGRIVALYWTDGSQTWPSVSDEVKFYVTLNLVVKTEGYIAGDCIEVTLQHDDGSDIVAGKREITIHGFVDFTGWVFIKEALKPYTIILYY